MSPRDLGRLALVPFAIGLLWPPPAAASPSSDVCVIRDPAIVESSGLVATQRWFVTVNDSGDGGRLFLVDKTTCDTVGVTTWDGDPFDVEAVAPAGDDAVWVGDIGDNLDQRESIEVLRVPLAEGEREADVEAHTLVYPDRAHNAESLVVEPGTGRLMVITKDVLGAAIYVAPPTLGSSTVTLTKQADGLLPVATDAAFFPDGEHLVVRNYRRAVVYTWPELDKVGDFILPSQPQGEGVAVRGESLYLSSEGTQQPVVKVELPTRVRVAMGLEAAPSTPDATPDTSSTAPEDDDELDPTPWVLGGAAALVLLAIGAMWVRRDRGEDD